jgi:glycerophosphoryl diester phosphodiesterase
VLAVAACGGSGDAPAANSTGDGGLVDRTEIIDRNAMMNVGDVSANDGEPWVDRDALGNGGDASLASDRDAVSRDTDGSAPDRISPMRPDGAGGPLTIEALQVAGTHNSYHRAPTIAFDASHKYTHLPLDQQLAGGVRGLELDLHLRSDGVFDVYHLSLIDPNSTCNTLEDCLRVVAGWSSAHASHTPIFIWFELKDANGGQPINDLVPVEAVISKVFQKDQLITAAWLRGSFASPHERITTAGWPTLEQARGRIMFSIINRDARTQQYSHDFTSLEDRLMFVSAASDQYDMPWACITKIEPPTESALVASAHAAHLLIATNTCAVNLSDDQCTMLATAGITGGIHSLHDDLPFPVSGRAYSLKLPNGSPGCNPVTSPASCDPHTLE